MKRLKRIFASGLILLMVFVMSGCETGNLASELEIALGDLEKLQSQLDEQNKKAENEVFSQEESTDETTQNSENTSSGAVTPAPEVNQSKVSTPSSNNTQSSTSVAPAIKTIPIDSQKTKTSLTKEQVIAKMPAKLKGTTIEYMYWWNPKEQNEAPAIASFEKATGIKLKPYVASYSGFYSQLAAKVASGNAPDLVRLMGNSADQISSLQPITNSGFDFNDTAWDFNLIADYTLNKKPFAVNLKNSAVMDYAVIYYNKAALKSAEMEDPYTIWKNNPSDWTWSKFWSMCNTFVKAKASIGGMYYGATFEYPDAYVRAKGGSVYTYDSASGKFKNTVKSAAMEEGWKTTLKAISNRWLIMEHNSVLFDSGNILFFWSGPYSARVNDDRQWGLKLSGDLGVVPLPTDSTNQTLYEYTAFGIPKGAKNVEAVPYYLRWVLDQSSYGANDMWINAEAKAVMDYAASGKYFYGSYWYTDLFNSLYSGGEHQVGTVLSSYRESVSLLVAQENSRISNY